MEIFLCGEIVEHSHAILKQQVSINTSKKKRSRSAGAIAIVLTLFTLGGCSIGTPFQTIEKVDQTNLPGRNDAKIAVVTEFTIGSDSTARAHFWDQVWTVERTMKDQPGFVGYALRRELLGNTAWTLTVWNDEQSMRNFVRSPVHQTAIAQVGPTALRIRFARFALAPNAPPPTWDEALAQIEKNARTY